MYLKWSSQWCVEKRAHLFQTKRNSTELIKFPCYFKRYTAFFHDVLSEVWSPWLTEESNLIISLPITTLVDILSTASNLNLSHSWSESCWCHGYLFYFLRDRKTICHYNSSVYDIIGTVLPASIKFKQMFDLSF